MEVSTFMESLMMRAALHTLFLLASVNCYAQKVIDIGNSNLPVTASLFYTVGGEPVNNAKYVKIVEGTPYFNEAWTKGKIMMQAGNVFDNVPMRLDLMDNSVHYQDKDRNEMIATSPIKSITLTDAVTGNEYQFDHSLYLGASGKIEPGWYEQLVTGTATLYKGFTKVINENKPYGSAITEQIIKTSYYYFVMVNSVFTPVKRFKDLPGVLNDKKDELKNYISTKNLPGRADADYIAVISYYNSLVEK